MYRLAFYFCNKKKQKKKTNKCNKMTETNVFVGLMIRRVQIESKSKPGPFYRYNQSTEEIKDKSTV